VEQTAGGSVSGRCEVGRQAVRRPTAFPPESRKKLESRPVTPSVSQAGADRR
jgi:hypothetical protein